MKRAACLLLLFAVWLLAAPGVSSRCAPDAVARHATLAQHDGKACAAVEHVISQLAALSRVPRAPLWARLPALPTLPPRAQLPLTDGIHVAASDLREALRRVQTRRRVPRLNAEEPPWC